MGAGLGEIDAALIEAARDVGAGPWPIFWHVIVPLTRSQALVALTLDFLGVLGSFTIPYLLGPTAPMMMGPLLNATYNDYREPVLAAAQAVILFLIAALGRSGGRDLRGHGGPADPWRGRDNRYA